MQSKGDETRREINGWEKNVLERTKKKLSSTLEKFGTDKIIEQSRRHKNTYLKTVRSICKARFKYSKAAANLRSKAQHLPSQPAVIYPTIKCRHFEIKM